MKWAAYQSVMDQRFSKVCPGATWVISGIRLSSSTI